MGMFDYIKCDMPLPNLPKYLINKYEEGEISFQTKDTYCQTMQFYKITKDGELVVDSFLDGEQKESKHNGSIRFYTDFDSEEETDKLGWIEYEAEFVDGLLQGEIELHSLENPSNFTEEELEVIEKREKHFADLRKERIERKIEKINDIKVIINNLASAQDELYNNLLSSIEVKKSSEEEEWVFDYIYNAEYFDGTEIYPIEKVRELLSPY